MSKRVGRDNICPGCLVTLRPRGYNYIIEKFRHMPGLVIERHSSIPDMVLVLWPGEPGEEHYLATWRLEALK